MYAEIALLDKGVRPNSGGELLVAHHLAGPLSERHQHLQGAGPDRDRVAVPQQQLLSGQQPEAVERDRLRNARDAIG
jgi:hypothetical protein